MKKKLFHRILFFSFCLFLFAFLIIRSSLSLRNEKNGSDQENVSFKYFLVENSSKERELTSLGLATFKSEMNSYYLSNENSGKYSLLSSFGTEEWQCVGSCWCGEEDLLRHTRRFSKVNKIGGAFFLLAALSSTLAYQKAGEYFSEDCRMKFENTQTSCDPEFVHSEVDSCERLFSGFSGDFIYEENTIETDSGQKELIYDSIFDETDETVTLNCEGFCVENRKLRIPGATLLSSKFNCEDLSKKGKMVFSLKTLRKKDHAYPHQRFRSFVMKDFCREESKQEIVDTDKRKRYISLCVSQNNFEKKNTISCRRPEEEKVLEKKFLCNGYCLRSKRFTQPEPIRMSKEFGCHRLKLEEEIQLDLEDLSMYQSQIEADHLNYLAIKKFAGKYLRKFCMDGSRGQYVYESVRASGRIKRELKKIRLCVSQSQRTTFKNIQCVQTYPKPRVRGIMKDMDKITSEKDF